MMQERELTVRSFNEKTALSVRTLEGLSITDELLLQAFVNVFVATKHANNTELVNSVNLLVVELQEHIPVKVTYGV